MPTPTFAYSWAAIDNPNMMVGIPIYGSEPSRHDYVVQSQGAFDETIRGILNLASLQQRVEIRVVVHKQTAPVLVEIAEFICPQPPIRRAGRPHGPRDDRLRASQHG